MTASPNPLSIHAFFEQQAERNPGHCAISFENQTYSYQELNHKANQIAHFLLKKGLKPQTMVGLCLERSPELIIALLGILKAGGAYVPMDPKHPPERLQNILEDTQAPWLLTLAPLSRHFPKYRGEQLHLDQVNLKSFALSNPQISLAPDNLAYVIYTSGSSGKPKGVLIEHQSLIDYRNWFADYSACAYPQKIDFSQNAIFDMAITNSLIPFTLGLSQVICPEGLRQDPWKYLQYLDKQNINIIKITPSYFKLLLHTLWDHPCTLEKLQMIILGGENLSHNDCAKWLRIYPQHLLINEYGPTEATVALTQFKITRHNVQQLPSIVPIGKAGQTMTCHILDSQLQPVEIGASGELHIGGSCLARGYLNQLELTQKQFIPDPFSKAKNSRLYKTGDLACFLDNGDIQLLGRIDEQVKVRGYRIEPAEIETCLRGNPEIKDVLITSINHGTHDEKRLIAYYIPKNQSEINPGQLRHYLKMRLASYMLPSAFVCLSSFPLNSNGKLDKNALPLPSFRNPGEKYLAPQSLIEKELVRIWTDELHIEAIGVNDHFLDLGGHSLAAARIITQIRKHFFSEIPMDSLYRHPTIAKLAEHIKLSRSMGRKTPRQKKQAQYNKLLPLGEFQFMYWLANLVAPQTKRINIVGRKRVAGKLDMAILSRAFSSLFEKHEVMLYKPSRLFPAQYRAQEFEFKPQVENLEHLSKAAAEVYLKESLQQLKQENNWGKNPPLIKAKVFFLNDGSSEIQVCLSHIIFDEVSRDLIFSDLSAFYQWHQNKLSRPKDTAIPFQDFVQQEWTQIHSSLDKDLEFWESYLKNTDLVVFPKNHVVKDMEAQGFPYSSYLELPESWPETLKNTCQEHRISQVDLLCASLGLALADYNTHDKKVLINLVKSARQDQRFDKTLGCFLRLDSIKLDLNQDQDLIRLSKQIQKDALETLPFQTCPGGVKMACLNYTKSNTLRVMNQFLRLLLQGYSQILNQLNLDYKILSFYPNIIFRRQKPGFVVNLNLLNDFISQRQESEYFGFQQKPLPLHHHDLCNIDNVLEICLLKDEHEAKNYLVISGNLQPNFREKIGKKIIETLI